MTRGTPLTFPRLDRGFALARARALAVLAPDRAGRDPLAALSARLGRPVRLLGIDRGGAGSDDDAICVHVGCPEGGSLAVRVSAPLAAEVAGSALGMGTWAMPVGEPPEPFVGILAVQALRCLDTLAGEGHPLELIDVHAAALPRPTDPPGIPLSVRLVVGTTVGRVEVDVRPDGATDEPPRTPPWIWSVPIRMDAVVARGRVRSADLLAVATGDAVVFDSAPRLGDTRAAAWLEPSPSPPACRRWMAALSDGNATVVDVGPASFDSTVERRTGTMDPDSQSDRTAVTDAPAEPLAGLEDVPVEVTAVAGRTTMPLRDVAALAPGSVVPLHRTPGGAVDLLANGVGFARGRLVDLDGELAVEISEVRATPARPPDRRP